MKNLDLTIMLGIFITVVPFIIYNYKNIKTNKTQTILWGILSFMLCFLAFKVSKTAFHYIGLPITVAISTIFNYFIVTKDIDIKKIPKSVLVLALFFFISLIQLIPISIFDMDINNLTNKQQLSLTLFSDTILLIILGIIYFKTLKEDFKKIKGNFYQMIDTGIKYWFIGLVVMMASNIIINLFITGAQATNEQGVQELISASSYMSLITVGILAPIIEELTFRKAFKDVFKNKWAFILCSGLIFGALHVVLSLNSLWDLFYIIPYSSLGIAFGYTYYKTDNIYTSIIMHIFHNTALTILSIMGGAMILL